MGRSLAMVDESFVGALLELLQSRVHGPSRVSFVEPIARLGTEAMRDALSTHLEDPQIAPEIQTIQKKIGKGSRSRSRK